MEKTDKHNRLPAVLVFIAILIYAGVSSAAVNHSIHIEWDYDQSSIPENLELSAYRLYQEGIQVCQFDYPYNFEDNCEFQSENGTYNFTLTAVFDDGSESPESEPFPFLLGPKKANRGVILAVLGLLLK